MWYGRDGSQNWVGQDWKAATRVAMRHGGARVEPAWATPAYAYYGGVIADTGFVVVLDNKVHVEREPPPPGESRSPRGTRKPDKRKHLSRVRRRVPRGL